ncbi:conserved hypothetical protein [Alkaliphilus metalliredigens QYMF]|uniref:Uncharacterized protein n=1 Tax=Alkaliphilus metalliredigens (strain QYMF) TaxID=293826 RepID=A6TQ88_ALKMQ|nr:hypothetical protein [Alkaliphilus metalliredigens]ABR48356.1 conserved hypothetical protein [Alkaliphilus metalliredigens QYMF]
MKIVINKVNRDTEDIIIDFTTEFGSGAATWNGNRMAEQDKEYDVQYDITDSLAWGEDVVLSKEKKFSIAITQEGIFITGVLEKVFKDGLVDLRFGKSIIQLEVEGNNLPRGQYVKVRADSLEVYDVNQ